MQDDMDLVNNRWVGLGAEPSAPLFAVGRRMKVERDLGVGDGSRGR